MKLKFLLFTLLLSCGVLSAQDTIKSLVITEARLDRPALTYIELTNMGADPVNLQEFELGRVTAWNTAQEDGDWFNIDAGGWMMLPDEVLEPGESWVIGSVEDWRYTQHQINPFEHNYFDAKLDVKQYLDYEYHIAEAPSQPAPGDSVDAYDVFTDNWDGRTCIYIRHHLSNGDSVVVDQVAGMFTQDDGTNPDAGRFDVAGFPEATFAATLMRKFSVTEGNVDFETHRGVDLEDSEWIPVPHLGQNSGQRAAFWTIGNHDNYTLDETTLTSSTLEVDWDNNVITVPWGVRRDDSLMFQFDKREGLAWHYDYVANSEDSAYLSARTGDTLTIYAIGNTLQEEKFVIQVAPPTEDANIVVPMHPKNEDGFYEAYNMGLYSGYCQVTDGVAGMDTIKAMNGITGIGFSTRVDSLEKYLEFPSNASHEFVFLGGEERADLIDGDILKVIAENGEEKEYYIKVDVYRPNHNALLSAITWPDIPDDLRDIFGWDGDTIPDFKSTNYSYTIELEPQVTQVPALVAKPEALNTKVDITRATSLVGSSEDRTIRFNTTAEDDTTLLEYSITLSRRLPSDDVQPFSAEPFISQFIFRDQWSNNFIEICNPGNQPLDLSDYMFFHGTVNNPADAIAEIPEEWRSRYRKYIPGMKWQTEDGWAVEPYIAEQDLAVNPMVQGDDVFVITRQGSTGQSSGQNYPARDQWDIDFANNPWEEDLNTDDNVAEQWYEANFYIWKILNDSIKEGTKPATDPADFELIEAWGTGDENRAEPITGTPLDQIQSYTRKPQYWQGHPEFGASYGTEEESEWTMTDRAYWSSRGYGWPQDILLITTGIGSHYLNEITVYKSTVSSKRYIVDEGYKGDLQIRGVVTGETVSEVFEKITKADAGQTLTVESAADGSELANDAEVSDGDILVVVSANGENTTEYVLEVTADGLSDDAVLTSDTYDVNIEAAQGTITGIPVNTTLKTVVAGVEVPQGAKMTIIDDAGFYVPLQRLNFDTTMVDVMANDATNFIVVAEDGQTTIEYQVVLDVAETDAFVTSDVYDVDQDQSIIDLIPEGTTVSSLLNNIVPVSGATVIVTDKNGLQRESGGIYKDDRVVVTAADGTTSKTYFLAILGDVADYLAYVVSDMYLVDEEGDLIESEMQDETVAIFLDNLTAAPGASVVIVDADGNEKAEDALVETDDIVRVTSGNGNVVNEYVIDLVTSVNELLGLNINMYPNPTNGQVTIEGLEVGYKVQVYNSAGVYMRARIAQNTTERISLENEAKGLYFVVISGDKGVLGTYKLFVE
ncbi:MAG: T9SS type A sorting domain-containing protein [Bacteroidota bacterium]